MIACICFYLMLPTFFWALMIVTAMCVVAVHSLWR